MYIGSALDLMPVAVVTCCVEGRDLALIARSPLIVFTPRSLTHALVAMSDDLQLPPLDDDSTSGFASFAPEPADVWLALLADLPTYSIDRSERRL